MTMTDANVNPVEAQGEVNFMTGHFEQLGNAMRIAGEGVATNRMLDAYMAADDFAEGHDRLAGNQHIQDLSGADKKLFALSSAEKQTHADRVTTEGAFEQRLNKIAKKVRGTIDDEIEERANDTLAFWAGDDVVETDPAAPTPPADVLPADDATQEYDVPPFGGVEVTQEFVDAMDQLAAARTNLARIRAGREARTVHGRRVRGRGGAYSNQALSEALDVYQAAERNAGALGVGLLQNAGHDTPTIEGLVNCAVIGEAYELTMEQHDIEMQAADNRGRFLRWFSNTWARHSDAPLRSRQGVKNMAVKSAMMAPVGLAMGILAAPVVAAAGAAAGGALVASRATRGMFGARMSREAEALTVAGNKATGRLQEIARISAAAGLDGVMIDPAVMSELHVGNTNEVVSQNRKRMVKSAVTAAVIGTTVSVGLEAMGFSGFWHNDNDGGSASLVEGENAGGRVVNAKGGAKPSLAQAKILRSDDFAQMVATGEQMHAQVEAAYPVPSGAGEVQRMAVERVQNTMADIKLRQALNFAATLENAA